MSTKSLRTQSSYLLKKTESFIDRRQIDKIRQLIEDSLEAVEIKGSLSLFDKLKLLIEIKDNTIEQLKTKLGVEQVQIPKLDL